MPENQDGDTLLKKDNSKTRPSALGMSDPRVEPLEILEILELETPPYHPHLDFLTTCLFGHPEENC